MKERIYGVILGAILSSLIIIGITKRAIDVINYLTM